jgi:transcriptional regulator with XRE-family HTH domain
MSGATSTKPGGKPERDLLCREMLARGCTLDQVAEEMMRRWGFRPRQAWRYAHRMTQRDVAARYNELANDPDAKMIDKRISDYENWPRKGSWPSLDVLAILAQVYETRLEKLIDYRDLEAMPTRDATLLTMYPLIRDLNRVNSPTLATVNETRDLPVISRVQGPEPSTASGPAKIISPLLKDVIMDAAHESSEHAANAEQTNAGSTLLEQLRDNVIRLARASGKVDLVPVFPEMVRVRNQIYQLLDGHQYPRQTNELYFLASVICGVLADVSDCFGYRAAAVEQTRAAWAYAEIIGHNSLRVWCRTMQAFLAQADERPRQALALAQLGRRYAGSSERLHARLHNNEGLYLSFLGRKDEAVRAFDLARESRSRIEGTDELFDDIGGTFGSPIGGQFLTAANGFLKLGLAVKAEESVQTAIDLYVSGPANDRDYGKEANAQISLATARLMRRDVDAAREALRPVLALPTQRRVGWLGQYMKDFRRVIIQSTLQGSSGLRELETEVEEFLETMLPQELPGTLYG